MCEAELAARFVAASLVDKVRQMKTAEERGRGVGGHALSGVGRPCPSVVTWAPPHVTLTTQWGQIKKRTEKQDERTGLLKGLSKEGAGGGGGGHALGRGGVGVKARKSKEEEASSSKKKKSSRNASPTRTKKKSSLDSSLKASEKGFGAEKVWALGDDVPVPYAVRRYAPCRFLVFGDNLWQIIGMRVLFVLHLLMACMLLDGKASPNSLERAS